MSEKTKKVKDIIEESSSVKCAVKRTLKVTSDFLRGPMCGRCFPCSFGSYEAKLRLQEVTEGRGSQGDVEVLSAIGDNMLLLSMCKRGKDVATFLIDITKDPSFEEHMRGVCAEKECKDLIEYRNVPENCIRCGLCQDACKFDAIIGQKQVTEKCCFLPFEIRQRRCTKCGECIKVCPTNAIVVVSLGDEAGVEA